MESGEWVVCSCILFIFVSKVLEYTSSFHDNWIAQLSLTPQARNVGQKYHEILQQRVKLQEENHSISAQDNYARWTKNNRKLSELDKQLASLREQLKLSSASSKKFFSRARLIGLTIPFWIMKIWKRGHIVYRLPQADLFPKLMTGVCARGWFYLAFAPINFLRSGSLHAADFADVGVSLGIWIWALQKTVDTIEFLVRQLILSTTVAPPNETPSRTADPAHRPPQATAGLQYEITDDKIELD